MYLYTCIVYAYIFMTTIPLFQYIWTKSNQTLCNASLRKWIQFYSKEIDILFQGNIIMKIFWWHYKFSPNFNQTWLKAYLCRQFKSSPELLRKFQPNLAHSALASLWFMEYMIFQLRFAPLSTGRWYIH